MKRLSELGFRYRKVVGLVIAVTMLYGALQFFSMPAREDPVLTIRSALVIANHPGLSAERMEQQVVKPIEAQIRKLPEIKEIRSTVRAGSAVIQVEAYFRYTELDQVWDELDEAVQAARPQLPSTMGELVVDDNFGDVAVITIAMTANDFPQSDLYDYAQYVRDQLVAVPGTRKVEILGAADERIYLHINNAALAAAKLPLDDVVAALREQNIIRSGGAVNMNDRQFLIEPSGVFDRVEELRELLIRNSESQQIVRLVDVAKVSRGYADPPNRKAYFNGEEAVVLSIVMQPDRSAINYSAAAKTRLEEIISTLPRGIDVDVITFQADQVKSAVYGVSTSVLQTLLIVLVVVIIFLGLRTGLVVGSIVPIVILMTIAVMSAYGIPLQRMSLATLVIALGLLVDNGIVVAEDYQRRLANGKERGEALRRSGEELALPLLSSSLTTMVFFLPLALAAHASSEYTRSISEVVVIALAISWLVAIMATPTLCYYFVKAPKANEQPPLVQRLFARLERAYEQLLRSVLRFRWVFMVLMALAFVGGGKLVSGADNQFFPNSDRQQVLVYLDLPEGVSAEQTDAAMQRVMQSITDREKFPDFRDFAAYVGFGGPRFVLSLEPVKAADNVGFVVINIDSLAKVDAHITALQRELAEQVPDAFVRVSKMFLGPQDPNTLQLQVKGPDGPHLNQIAGELEAMLASVPGREYVWTDWYNPVDRLVVNVNQVKAKQIGLSSLDIADSLATLTDGLHVTRLLEGDEKIPIVLRAADNERRSVDYLKNFLIYPKSGGPGVPLSQVASVETDWGYGRIQRENLVRTVTIEAKNTKVSPEDMVPLISESLEAIRTKLKPGHSIEYDGTIIDSGESQQAIGAKAPLALGLIIFLLLIQFNSFRSAAIVLAIVPLSIIGAGVGLTVMNAPFGFMVILGLFALFGIIVNNAIMLIDRIGIEVAEASMAGGNSEKKRSAMAELRFNAVVSASSRRLRPILMATITTVLGLLPLIIGQDVLFYNLAVVIAFGLAVGTVLTLGVVPVLYCWFYRVAVPSRTKNSRLGQQKLIPNEGES